MGKRRPFKRRGDLERNAPRQPGMGDLEAGFREVMRGFDTMDRRIPDRVIQPEDERAALRDADRIGSVDVKPDGPADPGGVDLDLDVEPDLEGL